MEAKTQPAKGLGSAGWVHGEVSHFEKQFDEFLKS
jgi:hypothetical protein